MIEAAKVIDPRCAEWQALATRIAAMRADQLQVLVARETPEATTQYCRGWIAALDELVRFVEEPQPAVEPDPAAPY